MDRMKTPMQKAAPMARRMKTTERVEKKAPKARRARMTRILTTSPALFLIATATSPPPPSMLSGSSPSAEPPQTRPLSPIPTPSSKPSPWRSPVAHQPKKSATSSLTTPAPSPPLSTFSLQTSATRAETETEPLSLLALITPLLALSHIASRSATSRVSDADLAAILLAAILRALPRLAASPPPRQRAHAGRPAQRALAHCRTTRRSSGGICTWPRCRRGGSAQ
ncbi:hypothetical protein TRAPUB_2873 [Trametes pubescens]|uniref:Uncharacterized protein n=1 Tax=Trametes pubescens TaxID=154538 RepID=A0A1M2VFI0_TRAPU|nr:hypothetical protein TRAPUB_2873 [Trametes pubescens]